MMIRSESKSKLQKVFSVLAKTYPRLRDYLTKTGSIPPEETIVITPKRFQDILDSVRPKHRNLPETEQEAREYWRSMLKKLRWVIADDKRIPVQAILFNDTIEAMLNDPPTTVEQLLSLLELRRNRTNIRGYENIVLRILKECREVIGKNKETPKPQENEKA
jgi:ribonuclease D